MPKTSIVTFGINEALHKSGKQAETVIHSVNSAISCHSISEMSNLYIPIWAPHTNTKMSSSLSFPYMSPHQRKLLAKPYEWSAIVSSAIETITFPTRSTAARSCLDLGNIVNIVNSTGSVPVAGLSTSFPFPLLKSMSKDGKFEEGPVVSSLWTGVFDKPQKGVSTINWLENLSSSSRSGSGSSRNGNGDDGIKSSSQDKVQEEFGNLCVLRGLSNQKRLGGGGFLSVPSIDEALSKFLSNAFPTTISNGKR